MASSGSQELTCHNSGHHGGEHEEQLTKKKRSCVVESFGSIVAVAVIQKTDEQAHYQVRREPPLSQILFNISKIKVTAMSHRFKSP